MYSPEIYMLNMMVLGVGVFGRLLGHEWGALMSGINTIIKEAPFLSSEEEDSHLTMLGP